MGGKQKQAQRTKNNVRPSNSGRSAEFLGNNAPHLLTLAGIKNVGFSLAPADDFDSSVDINFQLVFKKLNKKDATTKLKALNEFTELINTSEPDLVKTILPFWSRVYGVLATDTDHKVREATHVAHNRVVLKVKRNLAPYLKQLIGPWFTSQYDAYAPASTAANRSFQDAFSGSKLQEAVVFCQDEILNYIYENLISQTAQNISKNKITPEDCKAKYERLLITSLSGYSLYLTTVNREAIKKVEEANRQILSNPKFWKLSKYELAHIRSAWFSVISSLCQKAPFLLENETVNLTKAIFNNLDEEDPVVHSSLWDSALLVVSLTEWCKNVNIEEILQPKMNKVLKEGGFGNASIIYPNFLPLLSHLPKTLSSNFFSKFFENMREGFSTVKTSQAESRAISVSFIECFQYVIFKNQNNIELCDSLINNQLMPTIETTITNFQPANKTFYNQVSSLSQYWNKNKSNIINYKHYFTTLWNLIKELLQRQINCFTEINDNDELKVILERQIYLILSLKHVAKSKKKMKVKFGSDFTKTSERSIKIKSEELDECYLFNLRNIAGTLCVEYIKIYNSYKNPVYLEHISTIIHEFESKEFLLNISNEFFDVSCTDNCLKRFCFNFIIKWMGDSESPYKPIVNLLFLFFKYLTNEDKKEILSLFNKMDREDCLGYCIANALICPHNSDSILQEWLGQETVEQFLITIHKYATLNTSNSDFDLLLKQAFIENENQDLLISDKCVKEIIKSLCTCLLHSEDYKETIDTLTSFSSYLTTIIYTEKFKLKYGDELFISLFCFCCNQKGNSEFLSNDTLWEANTSWQDSLTILANSLDKSEILIITEKSASIIEACVIPENSFENISEKITSFTRCIYRSNQLFVSEILKIFLNRDIFNKWNLELIKICNESDYVNGYFTSPTEKIGNHLVEIDENSIVRYFLWKVIVLNVISNKLENDCVKDDEENDDYFFKIMDVPENIILELLLSLSIGKSLIRNFKNMKYFDIISNYCHILGYNLRKPFDNLDNLSKSKLKENITVHLSTKSWLYASVAFEYHVKLERNYAPKIYEELISSLTNVLGKLHLTQVFSNCISYDNIFNHKLSIVESIVILKCLAHHQEIDVQISQVFGLIEKLRNGEMERSFYNINFSNWEQTQIIIEIMNLCTHIIYEKKVGNLSSRHWDFIVVSLGSWSAKLIDIKHNYGNIQVAAYISSVSKLFVSINMYIDNLQQTSSNNPYADEWNNVFVPSITTDLLKTWLYLAEAFRDNESQVKFNKIPFLQEFGKFITYLNPVYIFEKQPDGMPKWSKILKQSCSLLTSHVCCLQLWGYHMLTTIASELINIDTISLQTNTPHEKGMIFGQFKNLLIKAHDIVHAMLIDFKFGEDSCRVEPFTDSYTYTFAYLLIWDVLLILCEKSSTELRFQYSEWLRNEDLLSDLLTNIFKLMPVEVLNHSNNVTRTQRYWFLEKKILTFEGEQVSENIERMVCWVFTSTLSQLPASVRNWWSSTDSKTALIIERITTEFISPYLCRQELNDVMVHLNQFKNMIVKVHSREVVAVYTVEESQMELVIAFPPNYPLNGPLVNCNQQISGICHKQWLKQFRLSVLHQNSRIWDALSLWNNNLDKKFDGVEECYICFAILHPGTSQLPKIACKTCRKKFHAACLYKWISTSNKSACPICRTLF